MEMGWWSLWGDPSALCPPTWNNDLLKGSWVRENTDNCPINLPISSHLSSQPFCVFFMQVEKQEGDIAAWGWGHTRQPWGCWVYQSLLTFPLPWGAKPFSRIHGNWSYHFLLCKAIGELCCTQIVFPAMTFGPGPRQLMPLSKGLEAGQGCSSLSVLTWHAWRPRLWPNTIQARQGFRSSWLCSAI